MSATLAALRVGDLPAGLHQVLDRSGGVLPARSLPAVAELLAAGGEGWLVQVDGEPAGCAFLSPLPGLTDVYQLAGLLLPPFRNRGIGSRLLPVLLAALPAGRRVEVGLPAAAPAARYLARCGFQPGHAEIFLRHDLQPAPSPPAWPPEAAVTTLSRRRAAAAFLPLYDAAFAPHPWYQPYSLDEVDDLLARPDDLWFLIVRGRRCGFLWLRREQPGLLSVEPLGVVPAFQGQGWGRLLLQTALAQAGDAGAAAVDIGAWEENRPALALYRRLGFQTRERICYHVWTAA